MSSLPFLRRSPFPAAGLLSVLLLGSVAAVAAGGCGAADGQHSTTATTAAAPDVAAGDVVMAHGVAMSKADMDAAWAVRPAYVDGNGSATTEAYAYALTRPDVLQWMPCYCGCEAMDHRSNLDCFLRPRMGGTAIQFEEHASYCVICVDTALMAKRMVADGIPLGQIRIAVDAEFGGRAPGTNTELPPT